MSHTACDNNPDRSSFGGSVVGGVVLGQRPSPPPGSRPPADGGRILPLVLRFALGAVVGAADSVGAGGALAVPPGRSVARPIRAATAPAPSNARPPTRSGEGPPDGAGSVTATSG